MPSVAFVLEQAPGYLIRRAHQISVAIFAEQAILFDATPMQFAVLSVLRDAPGVDQITLAQRAAFDAATLGSVVGRLLAKGWVHRQPAERDRRRKLLWLTPQGEQAQGSIAARMPDVNARVLGGLDAAECQQLTALLAKLVAHHARALPD